MALIILASCYFLALVAFTSVWLRMPNLVSQSAKTAPSTESTGIIIVVRNEAKNIPGLLSALNNQTWQFFKVFIVDDGSTDNTREIIKTWRERGGLSIEYILLAENPGSPKKRAIDFCIRKYTDIHYWLVTDGDCRPMPDWVVGHLRVRAATQANFVSGPVILSNTKSYFNKLQHLEFLALIGSGGVGIAVKRPFTCNAANMAISSNAFIKVNGYANNLHVASGDDEFLMKKIDTRLPTTVKFIKSDKVLVATDALNSFTKFYNQRKRWAGKWRLHGWQAALGPLAIAIFYGCFLVATFYTPWHLGLIAWCLKGLGDLLYLKSIAKSFKQKFSLSVFGGLLFVYPFYVLLFAGAANAGSYRWKGRKYSVLNTTPKNIS